MADYLKFWGKAGGAQQGEPSSHSVAYHSLDVAAVADVLLYAKPRRLVALAQLLQTTPDNARRFLLCLIALHDVGKFSAAFQAKSEEAWPSSILGAYQGLRSGGRHDLDGWLMYGKLELRAIFPAGLLGWRDGDLKPLWAAVAGHHGRPVNSSDISLHIDGMGSVSWDAAKAFTQDVFALLAPQDSIPQPAKSALELLSWQLAGLTVLADWIGSNRGWFPYCSPDTALSQYWDETHKRAYAAVAKAGLSSAPVSNNLSPHRIFPEIKELSPLQRHVVDMPLPDGPLLAIIEDVTGSGKTEAALLLSARLLERGRANGLFFALPTMATANAMYERLGASYRRLFADDVMPSLVLAHGKRKLNDDFTDSILEQESDLGEEQGEAEGNESAAACAAWIADDRRKTFLAQVGVGTIDQAILGILPSKHQALRLWGLADKVLIIDEAHSYDFYMGREIETLLEFHAALGGSAIILSATLASGPRGVLAQAFAKGLGHAKAKLASAEAYPLLTLVSGAGITSEALKSREDRTRTLPVRRIASVEEAASYVEGMAAKGAAVAWIRNSVDDAMEATQMLRARGFDVVLLHSRFAMGDRLGIEEHVRTTLGPANTSDARRGFVLVGTQILEQSLDYDVDAMVTDLAPIDLMIQRAGRLWRHTKRKERPLDSAELVILSPDPKNVEDRDWYRKLLPRAASVYDHHGIVWRSADVMFDVGKITTPAGVRSLVERVYTTAEGEDIPSFLQAQANKAEGQDSAAASLARANVLKCNKGYGGETNIYTADTITPTRLTDPVTVFRLGKVFGERIVPFYRSDVGRKDWVRDWALSEVSLSQRKATGVPAGDAAHEKLIAEAKALWPDWEREQPLLVLEADGEAWQGAISAKDGSIKSVHYHVESGLRVI